MKPYFLLITALVGLVPALPWKPSDIVISNQQRDMRSVQTTDPKIPSTPTRESQELTAEPTRQSLWSQFKAELKPGLHSFLHPDMEHDVLCTFPWGCHGGGFPRLRTRDEYNKNVNINIKINVVKNTTGSYIDDHSDLRMYPDNTVHNKDKQNQNKNRNGTNFTGNS